MAEIFPFKGYIYNLKKIKDISNVIAPPWDLIDNELEKKLLSLSQWNIVKLIGKENNPEEVKEFFENLIENEILIQDEKENLYFLKTKFRYKGKNYERIGLLCILKIEDFEDGNIIPHEKIFQKYTDNRYKLIEKCKANFCPIFMLYQDKNFEIEKIIEKYKVYSEGRINEENLQFGKIENEEVIEKIKEFFKEKKIFIADGHHRYNASLLFYKNNPKENNRYVLTYITNIESEGVLIFPTHRYIPVDVEINFYEKDIEIIEKKNFRDMIKDLEIKNEERKIGMFFNDKFFILDLNDYIKKIKADTIYKELDTFILDNYIIKNFIKIKEETEFFYHTSEDYLFREYKKRNKGVIFFLNPVEKDLFIKICLNRKIMPPKSTYFYPKVPSGFVIYKFPQN
ncbi:MAG: DUF1015 domain-containing protein [Candidatus Omnitrophica bacterium]|nr:DUF1015 domain-containing protein [Candidatus Omnitrophota bacterium]MCM8806608.1 DUF1015 domain-containing protein [Candidatus Omnitrophota bacterium]